MAPDNGKLRFIHTSDWHLGKVRFSKRDNRGIPVEFEWIQKAAYQFVDYVRKNNIKLILMCGDILHRGNPDPTTENILAGVIRSLVESGISIVYLLGNHEVPVWGDHHAKIYETLSLPGVIICDEVDVHRINLEGQEIQICAIPYTALINNVFEEALETITDKLRPDIPTVLMTHLFITGVKLSGSDLKLLPQEPHISPIELFGLPFDYIALGHIHGYQQISSNPPAIYPGSLQRVAFDEEGETKGFVDVSIHVDDKSRVSWQFIPVETTRFITLNLDLRSEIDPIAIIDREIAAVNLEDTVVRIRISRHRDDPRPAISTIKRKALQNGALIVSLEEKIERTEQTHDPQKTEPSGNILIDVERYVKSDRKEYEKDLHRILKKIKELNT